jgi:hypothetical protein
MNPKAARLMRLLAASVGPLLTWAVRFAQPLLYSLEQSAVTYPAQIRSPAKNARAHRQGWQRHRPCIRVPAKCWRRISQSGRVGLVISVISCRQGRVRSARPAES